MRCPCCKGPLLCNYRSTPPRVGAVLLDEDGCLTYTDHAPSEQLLKQFFPRRDNQIASLEMLAIAYGLLLAVMTGRLPCAAT